MKCYKYVIYVINILCIDAHANTYNGHTHTHISTYVTNMLFMGTHRHILYVINMLCKDAHAHIKCTKYPMDGHTYIGSHPIAYHL